MYWIAILKNLKDFFYIKKLCSIQPEFLNGINEHCDIQFRFLGFLRSVTKFNDIQLRLFYNLKKSLLVLKNIQISINYFLR